MTDTVVLPFEPGFATSPGWPGYAPAWMLDADGMVYIRCVCGWPIGSPISHVIASDGTVTPEITHSDLARPGCNWSVNAKLDGWVDGLAETDEPKFALVKLAGP